MKKNIIVAFIAVLALSISLVTTVNSRTNVSSNYQIESDNVVELTFNTDNWIEKLKEFFSEFFLGKKQSEKYLLDQFEVKSLAQEKVVVTEGRSLYKSSKRQTPVYETGFSDVNVQSLLLNKKEKYKPGCNDNVIFGNMIAVVGEDAYSEASMQMGGSYSLGLVSRLPSHQFNIEKLVGSEAPPDSYITPGDAGTQDLPTSLSLSDDLFILTLLISCFFARKIILFRRY